MISAKRSIVTGSNMPTGEAILCSKAVRGLSGD